MQTIWRSFVVRKVTGLVLLVALLLSATISLGQTNLSGIYRDPEGLTPRKVYVPSFPYICTTYLVVKNPSCGAGISGWECNIQPSPSVLMTSARFSGDAVNFGAYPNFIVGLAEPLPATSTVTLCQFDFYFSGPGQVYLEHSDLPSGNFGANPVLACMGYDGNCTLAAMPPEHGGDGIPVFSVSLIDVPPPIDPVDPMESGGGQ